MQLVVFSMVLILSALLNAGFLSGTSLISECQGYISQGGELGCEMLGTYYVGFDPWTCMVICGAGKQMKLPEGVCLGGKMDCTPKVRTLIGGWNLAQQRKYLTSSTPSSPSDNK
uniref:Putative ixodes 10 kDa peptide protein n=1 Tax=Ixodes ricinus TaxID=34613 RepID=A0A0K8RD05_IXORI